MCNLKRWTFAAAGRFTYSVFFVSRLLCGHTHAECENKTFTSSEFLESWAFSYKNFKTHTKARAYMGHSCVCVYSSFAMLCDTKNNNKQQTTFERNLKETAFAFQTTNARKRKRNFYISCASWLLIFFFCFRTQQKGGWVYNENGFNIFLRATIKFTCMYE